MAKTDPLGLDDRKMPIELDPQLYGFSDKDLDRECVPSSSDPSSHDPIYGVLRQLYSNMPSA